ncbi:MAG: hypothetical protein ACJ79Q_05770, partial [Gemmatimonadaceae bacterium]
AAQFRSVGYGKKTGFSLVPARRRTFTREIEATAGKFAAFVAPALLIRKRAGNVGVNGDGGLR